MDCFHCIMTLECDYFFIYIFICLFIIFSFFRFCRNNEVSGGTITDASKQFCVSFHPRCDKFLFSSGHRISVLSLPENCCR